MVDISRFNAKKKEFFILTDRKVLTKQYIDEKLKKKETKNDQRIVIRMPRAGIENCSG